MHGQDPTPENIARGLYEQMHGGGIVRAAGGATVSGYSPEEILGITGGNKAALTWSKAQIDAMRKKQTAMAAGAKRPVKTTVPAAGSTAPPIAPLGPSTQQPLAGSEATLRALGVGEIIPAVRNQFKRGIGDVMASSPTISNLFEGRMPTVADMGTLSETQAGALQSALSSEAIDPADFLGEIQRQFQGFAPGVAAGQRATVSSLYR